ncbi:MAG: hypothetical protein LBE09_01530 [Christensenellaceae bacterium]|jgi:hypothetical protein|nr:hypothetical protein [Christensenellaceae bacterium]
MKAIMNKKISARLLPVIGFAIQLVVVTAFMSNSTTTAIAVSLKLEDYGSGVWFNAGNYNSTYTLVSENREQWNSDGQEGRYEYFLYKTSKACQKATLASVRVYHMQGYDTTLQIGVSYLTSEEVQYTFGLDVETKVGVVVAKFGGGWKWGDVSSRTISTDSTFTLMSNISSQYITDIGEAYVQQYYLLVRKVTRVVNKDKNGNITSHSNYAAITVWAQSGLFETFDIQGGINYRTIGG